MGKMLLLPMIVPLAGACLILAFARKNAFFAGLIMALAAFLNLAVSGMMAGKEIAFSLPWAGFGIDFSLRLYSLSALMLLVGSLTSFLVALYTWAFMKDKENASLFNAYFLVTLALASGALLADNFVLLLFFWEGILVTLFAMISSGGKNSFRTAVKALVIVGVTDICLMAGIALAGKLSGTLEISKMHISPDMAGTGAFLLLFIGALGKIGAMPFHTRRGQGSAAPVHGVPAGFAREAARSVPYGEDNPRYFFCFRFLMAEHPHDGHRSGDAYFGGTHGDSAG
jgi:NADH:ubiquinone oxidoreductase subunit 5 (subunit L)/multisubunit Na+/H+ antiporter MnhA subunit